MGAGGAGDALEVAAHLYFLCDLVVGLPIKGLIRDVLLNDGLKTWKTHPSNMKIILG